MKQNIILLIAAISGVIAVGIGAFGAHALKQQLLQNGRADTFELAVRYQFYHTLALLAAGILAERFPFMKTSAVFFLVGIVIFSGSLYTLALTNKSWWGAVTPIGGLAFILGWITFGWAVYKS